MNLNEHLLNVVVAVVVAAVTAAGTSYLVLRYTPVSMDQQRVERIMRDYLPKNPQILVEMTTQLDKRQASQQTKAISDNADAIFRWYPMWREIQMAT
jgi:hypothetical protein